MKKILLSIFALLTLTIYAQSIENVSPGFGDVPENVDVTITGANTSFSNTSGVFRFNQGSYFLGYQNTPTVINNTQVTATIELFQIGSATIPTGFYNCSYYQGTGISYILNDAFFVNSTLSGTFTISGTIVEGTGKKLGDGDPMVYSKIFLENVATQQIILANRTDANGSFSFNDLTAGAYLLHIHNHNNPYPLELIVGESYDTEDLNLQSKSAGLINGINNELFVEKFNLKIFPNHFSNELYISMNLEEKSNINFILLNIDGQKVLELNEKDQVGQVKINFSNHLSSLSKGVYFMETAIGNEKTIVKLIKK